MPNPFLRRNCWLLISAHQALKFSIWHHWRKWGVSLDGVVSDWVVCFQTYRPTCTAQTRVEGPGFWKKWSCRKNHNISWTHLVKLLVSPCSRDGKWEYLAIFPSHNSVAAVHSPSLKCPYLWHRCYLAIQFGLVLFCFVMPLNRNSWKFFPERSQTAWEIGSENELKWKVII